ncbi:hypothetical protein OVA24_06265 [Luteolibacter sp. SL250]|uniref:hypothetical protein n=1 Tax=Luteolibacter sp. SL250 TaxID=2995170 RepID=UPI00226E8926|nr:hypothetical protein [Luteolibacter sp. SL250]WAC18880.1 hypothetical protein OVA24_16740 [Luteolibacter sp. SL250]WAC20985.1 hypothetical protein OVA24_06265 [Luteolibacter sp. SL250]
MWIPLTEADLLSSLTESERDGFGRTDAPEDPGDRVPQLLGDLVAEIRGQIATCTQNSLSADTTLIPQSMRANALAIARWRLLITVPSYQPGDARKLEYENAVKYFAQVALCKIRPEPPDDAVPNPVPEETAQHGVQVVSGPGLRTGRQRMNGL